jgi:hypothetical protein
MLGVTSEAGALSPKKFHAQEPDTFVVPSGSLLVLTMAIPLSSPF